MSDILTSAPIQPTPDSPQDRRVLPEPKKVPKKRPPSPDDSDLLEAGEPDEDQSRLDVTA